MDSHWVSKLKVFEKKKKQANKSVVNIELFKNIVKIGKKEEV